MAKETLMKERESKTDIAYRLMLKRKKERAFGRKNNGTF